MAVVFAENPAGTAAYAPVTSTFAIYLHIHTEQYFDLFFLISAEAWDTLCPEYDRWTAENNSISSRAL
jgi:hypothetical protein